MNLAAVIKHVCRTTDTASRYGGEEFLVLLPEVELKDAEDKAEMIRKRVSELQVEGYPDIMTVSIGVTEYRRKESIKDLVGRCDIGLYRAKKFRERRNSSRILTLFFNPGESFMLSLSQDFLAFSLISVCASCGFEPRTS